MHFKFLVNATKFHVGRLVAAWVPLSTELNEINQYTLSGYPHVFIDAANSDASELIVPYFMPTNSFNMLSGVAEAFRTSGQLFVLVLNSLTATASVSSTIDVTIYAWFDDAEVRIPVDSSLTSLPGRSLNEAQAGFLDSITGALGIKGTGKIMDSVSSLSSGVQALFSGNFETAVGDFGSTLQNTADFAKDNPELLAMMFDRPKCLKTEISSKKMTFSSLAYGKGSDTVTRLGLMPDGMHIPDEAVMAGHVAESNLLELCRRPMLYSQYTWKDSDTVGTLLQSWPVSPTEFYHSFNPVLGQATYLSAISDLFAFWRGKIVIRLDIVASQFHSGRLAVCYVPEYLNAFTALNMQQCMSSPTVIIDLENCANNSFEIELPYISNRPWLRTDSEYDSEPRKRTVGMFYVWVLNALVHPDNVPNEIGVNMYVSAGDDFALAFPAPPVRLDDDFDVTNMEVPYLIPAVSVKKTLNETQSGEEQVADITEEPVDSTALVVTNNTLSPDYKHFFNEFSGDLRDVIRRYGMAYAPFVITSVSGATNRCFQLLLPVTPTGCGLTTYSPLGYYSRMFAGWSGSIRYKILFSNSQINAFRMTATHDMEVNVTTPTWNQTPNEIFGTTSGFYAIKVTNLTDEHGFELEVPYANPLHFCAIRGLAAGWDTFARYNGCLALTFELPYVGSFADNVEVAIYMAAGDDFNFHFPIPLWQRNVKP